jgi:hypothetical protein
MNKFGKPFLVTLALSPFLNLLGIYSAGFGHGTYIWARILFPYSMIVSYIGISLDGLVNAWVSNFLMALWIILFLSQFPIYGVLLGISNQKGKLPLTMSIIVIVHLVLTVTCFNIDY